MERSESMARTPRFAAEALVLSSSRAFYFLLQSSIVFCQFLHFSFTPQFFRLPSERAALSRSQIRNLPGLRVSCSLFNSRSQLLLTLFCCGRRADKFIRFSASQTSYIVGEVIAQSRTDWGGDRDTWVAFWLYPRQTGVNLFGFGRPGSGWALTLTGTTFGIRCGSGSGTEVPVTGSTFAQNAWNHYAVYVKFTSDNVASVTIYKNGALDGTYTATATGGLFSTAYVNDGGQYYYTAGSYGNADVNAGDFDLGPYYMGESSRYFPNTAELADMMRGRRDFYNPSLRFYASMRDTLFNTIYTEVVVNGTDDSFNPLQWSFESLPGLTWQTWACDAGTIQPWEQCDVSAVGCDRCACSSGYKPDASGVCALPRAINSAAYQLTISAADQLPAIPAPLYNLQFGMTFSVWVSISGSWSGGIPFFALKSANGSKSFGVGIDSAYNISFCNATGSRIAYPDPLLNPYTWPSGSSLHHLALAVGKRYEPYATQMPYYVLYVDGVAIRNDSERSLLLNNFDMDPGWTFQWMPLAPAGATINVLRPQLWADFLDREGILAAMKGIQPTATSQDNNVVFLASDEGSGTTTLNIAKNRQQSFTGAWSPAGCSGNGIQGWEQCDSGATCVTSQCVCAPANRTSCPSAFVIFA